MSQKITFPQTSYVGHGSIQFLAKALEPFAVKNVLVVTDQILMKLGIAEKAIESIRTDYEITFFSDVFPEPPLENAERLVEFTREGNYDSVIGVGGGSVLDLAKLAAVMAKNPGEVKEFLNLTGTRTFSHKGLPKVMIPTTAGTGSEVTDITVFSLHSTKDVITHPYLVADIAIVDSALTISVPPRITAATGIDALTHAIEAYLSVNANDVTDALAEKAIKLAGESLYRAVRDGEDVQARQNMSTASYLAGLSFFNAGVGGVHALAYPLGNQFKLPHGESNAVLLPYVLDYIQDSCQDRLAEIYRMLTGGPAQMAKQEASHHCVALLKNLIVKLGLPGSLKEYGIQHDDLQPLTDEAIQQVRLLARSPKRLEKEDIFQIYQAAFHGQIVKTIANGTH
jgi:alcohol dehydrogenase